MFVHELRQHIPWKDTFNVHDLPGAGVLFAPRHHAGHHLIPWLTVVAAYHLVSPVPRYLPPRRVQDVVGSEPEHLTVLSFGALIAKGDFL